ncbi:AAA family ATPase [Hutsoniella sourekii]|uniref:AAA family ATPase n=1 Tax=Hutsoniella sourekii TaxID=87650 RepID=UPI0004B90433|nr:AAA family ATPase [Hutsoniella sourekii]
MFRYLFTNDIRISTLADRLIETANMVQTDTVPSASENKSANNNANTLIFYFNLYKDNGNTTAAINGYVKEVVLNFMIKFQFPNPRTKNSFRNSHEDGIKLKPYQEIFRLLYIGSFENPDFYLTSDEIFKFIFLNPRVAKTNEINYIEVLNDLKIYRETEDLPEYINDSNDSWEWKQKDRQLKELLEIINWSDYAQFEDDKVMITEQELPLEVKAIIFDVITKGTFIESNMDDFEDFREEYKTQMNMVGYQSNSMQEIEYNSKIKQGLPRNKIIFGAPGTGKSFRLNEEKDALLKDGGEYERVTFHPDYSYGAFVGTYKPIPTIDSRGEESISYEYVPGPFMRLFVKAIKNLNSDEQERPFLLLIEEINRANTAAVFGDVFQLLDRKENISEYPIQTSEDMRKYLSKELGGLPDNYREIKLPGNLFIWATMNSADQGVFPMDTAFKRRWTFEYLDVDANENEISNLYVFLGSSAKEKKVKWNELRKGINDYLSNERINEDKLIGPFFINVLDIVEDEESEIIIKEEFTDVFKNKLLMYLFEDAARQRRDIFSGAGTDSNRFSKICQKFDEIGIEIFDKEVIKDVTDYKVNDE